MGEEREREMANDEVVWMRLCVLSAARDVVSVVVRAGRRWGEHGGDGVEEEAERESASKGFRK